MPLITDGELSSTGDRLALFSFPFGGMAVIDYPWKLVRTKGRLSLYNFADDPAESNELNELQPDKLAEMILLLESYLEEARTMILLKKHQARFHLILFFLISARPPVADRFTATSYYSAK